MRHTERTIDPDNTAPPWGGRAPHQRSIIITTMTVVAVMAIIVVVVM